MTVGLHKVGRLCDGEGSRSWLLTLTDTMGDGIRAGIEGSPHPLQASSVSQIDFPHSAHEMSVILKTFRYRKLR